MKITKHGYFPKIAKIGTSHILPWNSHEFWWTNPAFLVKFRAHSAPLRRFSALGTAEWSLQLVVPWTDPIGPCRTHGDPPGSTGNPRMCRKWPGMCTYKIWKTDDFSKENSQRIEKNKGFQRKIGQNMNKHDGCSISIVICWRLASNGFPFALSTEHPSWQTLPTHSCGLQVPF